MYTRVNSEKECCSKSSFRPRGNGPIGRINLRLSGFVSVLVLTSAIVGVIAATSGAGAADVTPFTVTIPTVTGPIPSTSTNFPYIADGFDVEPPVPPGYVEQEYFFSGTGNLYEYTPTGIEVVTPCPSSVTEGTNCTDIPYTTRMLVKRPIDPRKFSGTVIIEALNPSANFDIAAIWDRSLNYFVRDGDVFVGWTSKSVTVNTLKTWNPARYAPLEWTYAPFTPGSNNGVYDGITFDIAAQIGALFKQNGASSPLNGLNVKHVYEAGFSQDGSFTFTQADIFNALERMADGSPVYHGYVPGGTNGPSDLNFGLTAAGALPPGDPRVQMQPRDVPVIQTNTETEIALGVLFPGGLAYRRADSDARNDRYRLWEVPGASHVSNDSDAPVITLQLNLAELQGISPSQLAPVGCTHQQFINGPVVGVRGVIDPNDYPFAYIANAAFADLTKWIDFNQPPPHAPQIETTSSTPPTIVFDQFGNALGGVRTPFVDVPTATYTPTDTVAHTTVFSGFCILYGYNTPFSDSTLDSLYRSHPDYFGKVLLDSDALVAQGFWLAPDARVVVQKARNADVP
jgi:Alpha/beta hydrolase domain